MYSLRIENPRLFIIGGLVSASIFLVYMIVVAATSGIRVQGIAFLALIWVVTVTACVLATFWFGSRSKKSK